jgi:4Fe-4S ferredoxin
MEYLRLVCNKKQREGEYMALFPKFSKKKDGVNVVMEQKLLQNTSNLILNAETCTGCGICVDACPEEAIVLGLVGASRRGAINYAAPIDVDETKCSYCGVCVIMCPFNALTLKVDGQERLPIIEKEGFPQYDMKAGLTTRSVSSAPSARRYARGMQSTVTSLPTKGPTRARLPAQSPRLLQ